MEALVMPRADRISGEAKKAIVGGLESLNASAPVTPEPCPPAQIKPALPKVRNPLPLQSAACQIFLSQALPNVNGSGTEQLVITRYGKSLFDWHDGVVKEDTARPMWSISKSISATLIGAAVQAGKVNLDDSVAVYLPELSRGKNAKNFESVKIRDLIGMTSGLEWTENPQAPAPKQSDLSLFYAKGYGDLVKYIQQQPFEAKPGSKWNYASINAILSMAVIKKVSGKDSSDAPWAWLFNPLGMKTVRMERDRQGVFNGGAHVHMAARDLAKLGELYANNGKVGDNQILPEDWISQVASQPVDSNVMTAQSLAPFGKTGPYSKGGLWLNQAVPGSANKKRPYPNLPGSLLEASGAFGQKLIVLPDQGLVIARTAHDAEDFEYPVNEVVANALRCFAPGDPATPKEAIQPSAPQAKDFSLATAFEQVGDLQEITGSGALSGMLAKELCSCRYIAGNVDECFERSPIPKSVAYALFDIQPVDSDRMISISGRFSDKSAQAKLNRRTPREGCQISYGAADYRAGR